VAQVVLPARAAREVQAAQPAQAEHIIPLRSFLAILAIEATTTEAASKANPRLLIVLVNAVTGPTSSEPVQVTALLLRRLRTERRHAGTLK
jgi:hypothetical protein